jgi:hypothetical protein
LIPASGDDAPKFIKDQLALTQFGKLKENKVLTPLELKLKFIKQYKFEYLIVGQNVVLPDTINNLITWKTKDTKSGYTFCLLKTE